LTLILLVRLSGYVYAADGMPLVRVDITRLS